MNDIKPSALEHLGKDRTMENSAKKTAVESTPKPATVEKLVKTDVDRERQSAEQLIEHLKERIARMEQAQNEETAVLERAHEALDGAGVARAPLVVRLRELIKERDSALKSIPEKTSEQDADHEGIKRLERKLRKAQISAAIWEKAHSRLARS